MRLAADIFPAAESLHLEQTFRRFSWLCVLEAAKGSPQDALLFLNVNPRLIERSEHALVALGEETERRGVPFSRLVLDLVEVENLPSPPDLAPALTVPRDLGAVIALDDITSGIRNAAVLPRPAARVDQGGQRGDARHRAGPAPARDPEVLADLAREFAFLLDADRRGDRDRRGPGRLRGRGCRRGAGSSLGPARQPNPAASSDFRSWIASRPGTLRSA